MAHPTSSPKPTPTSDSVSLPEKHASFSCDIEKALRASTNVTGSGTSTNSSEAAEFAKALEKATSKRRKNSS